MTEKQLSDPICGKCHKPKSEHRYIQPRGLETCFVCCKNKPKFFTPEPAPEAPKDVCVCGRKIHFDTNLKRWFHNNYEGAQIGRNRCFNPQPKAPPVGLAQKR